MNKKLTKSRIDVLIETLNALICEEDVLSKEQRANMVLCVATLGALGERFSALSSGSALKKNLPVEKMEKKSREPDPVFPRSGAPWTSTDTDLIHSIIDDIPDDDIKFHIEWLSEKQGRTPYAIALKIVSEGRCNAEWAKEFKPLAKEIREQHKPKDDEI